MMMNGTNGSQLWDTSFAIQAFMSGKLWKKEEFYDVLKKAYHFIDRSQVRAYKH